MFFESKEKQRAIIKIVKDLELPMEEAEELLLNIYNALDWSVVDSMRDEDWEEVERDWASKLLFGMEEV